MNSGSGGGYVPYPSTTHPVKTASSPPGTTLDSGYSWLVISSDMDGSDNYPYIASCGYGTYITSYIECINSVYSDSHGCYFIKYYLGSNHNFYFIVTGGETVVTTSSGGENSNAKLIRL